MVLHLNCNLPIGESGSGDNNVGGLHAVEQCVIDRVKDRDNLFFAGRNGDCLRRLNLAAVGRRQRDDQVAAEILVKTADRQLDRALPGMLCCGCRRRGNLQAVRVDHIDRVGTRDVAFSLSRHGHCR